MKTADFDYQLPPERIAQTPLEPRDSSRLMIVPRGDERLAHRRFWELTEYLRAGDLLICNDSRVIPARLLGFKVPSGGKVEVLLLSRTGERTWEVLTRGKRILPGTKIGFSPSPSRLSPLPTATVLEVNPSGSRLIEFECAIKGQLKELGQTPLPPYITHALEDPERYQTVYARVQGSVAAPTAGLHFTPELIDRVQVGGARFDFVTLHIGLDTFRPVSEDNVEDHQIHTEYGQLSEETARSINTARREGRRIIAVGTTAVRVLESCGQKAYQSGSRESVIPFAGPMNLFIYPGHTFRVVDAMITNFHLPRSTLLMLVSAFLGRERILYAYGEAIRENYRFYSFGDAMLLLP